MKYLIISFRNRNSVYEFAQIMRHYGLFGTIINTPSSIGSSCTLSIKTDYENLQNLRNLISRNQISGFSGLYLVEKLPTHEQIKRIM